MTTPINQFNSGLNVGVASSAQYNENLFTMATRLRSLAVPALTAVGSFALLGGALGGIGGGVDGLTAAEAQLAEQTFRVGAAFKEAYAEGLEEILPLVERAVGLFLQADEATDGWSTRITALGLAAAGAVASLKLLGIGGPAAAAGRGAVAAVGAGGALAGSALTGGTVAGTVTAGGVAAGIFAYAHQRVDEWLQQQGLSGIPGGQPTLLPNLPPFVADYIEDRIRQYILGPSPPIDPGLGSTAVPAPVSAPETAIQAFDSTAQRAVVAHDPEVTRLLTELLNRPQVVQYNTIQSAQSREDLANQLQELRRQGLAD